MKKEIMELEKILEQEIEACSKLEKAIINKKGLLIKGDIEGLMKTDIELEIYNSAVEKLEQKRKFLETETPSLKIKKLRKELKSSLNNIEKHNNITSELLKHSLRIVESSILSITNILVPESASYNNKGKINGENTEIISSIIHEA